MFKWMCYEKDKFMFQKEKNLITRILNNMVPKQESVALMKSTYF